MRSVTLSTNQSSDSNKNYLRICIVAVFAFALIAYEATVKITQVQQGQALERQQYQLSVSDDAAHIMAKADNLRLYSIQNSIDDTGSISDKDLDWAIALTGTRNTSFPGAVTASVVDDFLHLRNIAPEQRSKLFSFSASLIATNNPADVTHLDQIWGSKLMGKLQDKRGVPLLFPLLQNSSPYVRKNAVMALSELHYSVGPSTP